MRWREESGTVPAGQAGPIMRMIAWTNNRREGIGHALTHVAFCDLALQLFLEYAVSETHSHPALCNFLTNSDRVAGPMT